MKHGQSAIEAASSLALAAQHHDAATAVFGLHRHVTSALRHVAERRHTRRRAVDIGHDDVAPGRLRRSGHVHNHVGRASHRHVRRHGLLESREAGDTPQQCPRVFPS
jgi:hypothetical protein